MRKKLSKRLNKKPQKIPVVIWQTAQVSNGARELAKALNCYRLKPGRQPFQPRGNKGVLVVNWGNSVNKNNVKNKNILNKVEAVNIASSKVLALDQLLKAKVPHPPFTTDYEVAKEWSKKSAIVGRSLMRASCGVGIALTEKKQEPALSDAEGRNIRLWVAYIPKRREYRVHVFDGKVIAVQQKRKKLDFHGEVDTKIRNHDNGWVFTREDVEPCDGRDEVAIAAVKALGLDFGAVDLIWNEKANQCYVLEVNTAPGLEGSTIRNYADAILSYLERTNGSQG